MAKRVFYRGSLSNYRTYLMYKRQLMTLTENVFEFVNLPNFIDTAFLNKTLLKNGSIVFFVDEVMGLLALPYNPIGNLDVYGRPQKIEAYSSYGYRKILKDPNEFVIMYDNNR